MPLYGTELTYILSSFFENIESLDPKEIDEDLKKELESDFINILDEYFIAVHDNYLLSKLVSAVEHYNVCHERVWVLIQNLINNVWYDEEDRLYFLMQDILLV